MQISAFKILLLIDMCVWHLKEGSDWTFRIIRGTIYWVLAKLLGECLEVYSPITSYIQAFLVLG